MVCEDADLERTSAALVWGAFFHCGQVCASVERVYVPEKIYGRLVAKVQEKAARLRQGDPLSLDTDVGAVTFSRQLEVAAEQVRDAVARGARVLVGGKRREGRGQFFPPTVLADCRPEMEVMRHETFGPLLPLMKVKDEEEAVRLANDSHLGLAAYVFGRNREKTRRLAERIEAGSVMINDVLGSYGLPETPWGGLKQSGLGRTHGDDGLRDLCQERHVNFDLLRPPRREIWWYPYGERTWKIGMRLLKGLFGKSAAEKIGALLLGRGI